MDNLNSSERGVFVYQVLQRVRPLESPSSTSGHATSSSSAGFHRGDLVSVDGIVSRGEGSNTYLHLSDGTGWLPTDTTFAVPGGGTMEVCKRVHVEEGLWTMYVDNCPMGQSLRHHPMDSVDNIVMKDVPQRSTSQEDEDEDDEDGENRGREEPIWYETMQRVTCDRKVVHPHTKVAFYRVQAVNKWLMDSRLVKDKKTGETVITQMLIDAKQVHTGVFCFQALDNLRVRSRCTSDDDAGTSFKIKKGALVSVDLIKESTDDNGPFLRLSDGSGWLFTHKNGAEMMKQVEVQQGMWELKVVNPPDGLALQRHPVEAGDDPYPHRFPKNTMVQADYRIRIKNDKENEGNNTNMTGRSPSAVIYYRVVVQGTYGWISDVALYWVGDKHGEAKSLQVLTESYDSTPPVRSVNYGQRWSPDFVRGLASTIPSLKEKEYQENPCNPVLVFQSTDGLSKIVYCGTRTIGILMPESNNRYPNLLPLWYRSCTNKELIEYMRKDAIEIMMCRDQIKEEDHDDPSNNSTDAEMRKKVADELKLRKELLAVDKEVIALEARRMAIVEKLKVFDEEHAKEARVMRAKMEQRRKWKPLPGEKEAIESSLADVISASASDSEGEPHENSSWKKKKRTKKTTKKTKSSVNDDIMRVRSTSPASNSSHQGKTTFSILKNSSSNMKGDMFQNRIERMLFLRGSASPVEFIEDFAGGYLEGSDSVTEFDGGTATRSNPSGSFDDDRTCSTYSDD